MAEIGEKFVKSFHMITSGEAKSRRQMGIGAFAVTAAAFGAVVAAGDRAPEFLQFSPNTWLSLMQLGLFLYLTGYRNY